MAIFICEKCGQVDNTACANNFWHVSMNKCLQSKNEDIEEYYQKEYEYFEMHYCCADCCEGVFYKDGSPLRKSWHVDIERQHWSSIGKDILLRPYSGCQNAVEYFNNHTEDN